MNSRVTIGIIGEYDGGKPSHTATMAAIGHAADALAIGADIVWRSTTSLLEPDGLTALAKADGIWASPGSPYESFEGAIASIRFARERGYPFFAT